MSGPRWLLHEPVPEASARLFCIPYSGCGATVYRQWPRFVDRIEICPVQLPGRETRIRERIPDTYEELADDLVPALLPYLDLPFGFFGHCASALIGYQAAVALRARGGPTPRRLFVSSEVAPHDGPYGRYLRMSRSELAEEIRMLTREMGGRPIPGLVELSLDVLTTDIAAHRRFVVEPAPLGCPITAIGWSDDTEIESWRMAGWSQYGQTAFATCAGGHRQFLRPPPDLLELINAGLL